MRLKILLAAGVATTIVAATPAFAQDVGPAAATNVAANPVDGQTAGGAADTATADPQDTQYSGDIIITARKRAESLQNVPVAVTAITGDLIESRGLTSIKDVAMLTPGLSINSDAAGRAFVAIRGVGVTLVDSVQPGVGIFLDGIYQPNTSYLNNPLVDVQRVEVLRGPQGTLYGKNTLGGAINVISRQPGNEFEGKVIASYAGPDDAWFLGTSLSGPIIKDVLQVRVAYAHRQQQGFIRNTVLNIDANPLNTDSLSGTIRFEPVNNVVLTVNGYYDWVDGGTVPYSFVTGLRDYTRNVTLNTNNYQHYTYKRANARLEAPLGGSTTLTLIGAYDQRDASTPAGDLDFSAVDIARNSGTDRLVTRSAEARFDSKLSDQLSSIVGAFYSRETRASDTTTTLFPGVLNIVNRQQANTTNDTWAVFGNVFWRPTPALEISAGLRYDEQKRNATGAVFLAGVPNPIAPATLREKHVSPRVAVTYKWSDGFMTYASVSRGFRGGGFNPPVAPVSVRTYTGDSVWTYEVGSKYTSTDRRVSLAGAVFYNDYKNYIGLNSIAPASTGGFTTVDLNSGDVESYGVELEGTFRPTKAWTITAGGALLRARLTNTAIYTAVTGRTLSSDRLTFQPDWNFSISSDYVVPIGSNQLVFTVGATGKGSRLAATLNQTTPTVLDSYVLTNGSITFRTGGLDLSAFVDNAFNAKYFESYIEKTTLILAGLTPSDVGIVGERRRYGVRARFKF